MRNEKTKTLPGKDPAETETIIITDDENTEDESLNWLDDFGAEGSILAISLHRIPAGQPLNAQGFQPFVASYDVNNPPTLQQIKNEHGGGNYILQVKIKDETKARGFSFNKKPFCIEGPPASLNGAAAAVPPAAPGAMIGAGIDTGIIATIKILKDLGLIGQQQAPAPAGDAALIVESMKNTTTMIVEMIKAGNNNAADNGGINNTVLKSLLDGALQKSDSTEQLKNLIAIVNSLQGGSSENTMLEIAKILAPGAMQFIQAAALKNKPAGQKIPAPVPAGLLQQQPAQIPAPTYTNNRPAGPAAQQIPGENILERILNAVTTLEKRVIRLELNPDILDEIEQAIENKEDMQAVYKRYLDNEDINDLAEFNNYLIELNYPAIEDANLDIISINENQNENNMFGFNGVEGFIEQLKSADFNKRVTILQTAATMFEQQKIYDFCLKHEVIKDIAEFNTYMQAAGLPDLPAGAAAEVIAQP